jgi:hypothetical protein
MGEPSVVWPIVKAIVSILVVAAIVCGMVAAGASAARSETAAREAAFQARLEAAWRRGYCRGIAGTAMTEDGKCVRVAEVITVPDSDQKNIGAHSLDPLREALGVEVDDGKRTPRGGGRQ